MLILCAQLLHKCKKITQVMIDLIFCQVWVWIIFSSLLETADVFNNLKSGYSMFFATSIIYVELTFIHRYVLPYRIIKTTWMSNVD